MSSLFYSAFFCFIQKLSRRLVARGIKFVSRAKNTFVRQSDHRNKLTVFPLRLQLAEGNPLHDEILHSHFRCLSISRCCYESVVLIYATPARNALFTSKHSLISRTEVADCYRTFVVYFTLSRTKVQF